MKTLLLQEIVPTEEIFTESEMVVFVAVMFSIFSNVKPCPSVEVKRKLWESNVVEFLTIRLLLPQKCRDSTLVDCIPTNCIAPCPLLTILLWLSLDPTSSKDVILAPPLIVIGSISIWTPGRK